MSVYSKRKVKYKICLYEKSLLFADFNVCLGHLDHGWQGKTDIGPLACSLFNMFKACVLRNWQQLKNLKACSFKLGLKSVSDKHYILGFMLVLPILFLPPYGTYKCEKCLNLKYCVHCSGKSIMLGLKPNSWTYNFVEVSGQNLESAQTWGFNIQFLHYKPVSNHVCWVGRGGNPLVEVTVNSKEETLKPFVPNTSKNLASGWGVAGGGIRRDIYAHRRKSAYQLH